ncbi:MAG: AAA family ATPase [Rhodoferax sp.]|nr:AAA family ATPase [Rhodoferax sp.]
MIEIPGYSLTELLYEGETSLVFRARRRDSDAAVILKVLKSDHPSLEELAKFRREFEMTRGLRGAGIIQVHQLEKCRNSLVMVLEDFGGVSLKHAALPLGEFLPLALQLVEIIGYIHQQQIIHKDLNPANIVWNTKTNQIKIIDFGISTQLSRETVSEHTINVNMLEGTLPYMSPEQTGRMNRALDYRTDYYSLGATFYEILTGTVPFPLNDPMEIVHCHLAKMPPPPHERKADIPVMLSRIVLKLMAKMAEDRYQSAFGLRADLQFCLEQYQSNASIADFPIGCQDGSDRFQIPQKLYGREREVDSLLNAFERVSQGHTEMMLVAGYSGIGKSTLVHEVHKPIAHKRGYFLSGKFDQYKRNIPYSSLIQAFQDLLRQLLTENETRLNTWRTKLRQTLGGNAAVIAEIIPELELIIGEQAPVAQLSPLESQNRFQRVLQQFVHIFAAMDHPLVLFLDDLQWADPPSLKLIESLMTAREEKYILLLGAYRDNEVNAAHPLMVMLDDIQKTGAMVQTLTLAPLNLEQVNTLVAETLHCPPQDTLPLAQLSFAKTAGNPFFLNQFLHAAYEEYLILFDTADNLWKWDIAKINNLGMTDNVVELMVSKIMKLSPHTQHVLKLAATIGNQFDLNTLTIINEKSAMETASDLWESLQAGFIVPLDNSYQFLQESDTGSNIKYRFLHDRVQQAAYSLIAESQLQPLHIRIGRLLLKNTPQDTLDESLFDILEQLNAGRELIEDVAEKLQLAELNLRAGKKAQNATAYQAAVMHLRIGMALLPQDAWQSHYPLTLALHRQCAEAEYLAGNFSHSEAIYSVALERAQTVLDKINVLLVQIVQHQMLWQFAEAIQSLKVGLKLVGFTIPENDEEITALLNQNMQEINQNLGGRQIEDLLASPPMTDSEHLATMQLLRWLFQASFLSGRSNLVALAICKTVNLSLQHGNSAISSFGYVMYGHILGWSLGDFKTGYQYGTLGITLSNHLDNLSVRADCYFDYALFIHHWNHPLRTSDDYYDRSFDSGLESGNLVICNYAIALRAANRLIYGKTLPDLLQICERDLIFLQGTKDQFAFDCLTVGIVQPIRALMGLTDHPLTYGDTRFHEAQMLKICADSPRKLEWYYHAQIRNAYLFEDRSQWPDLIEKLELVQALAQGQSKIPDAVFYTALMLLDLSVNSGEAEQKNLQQRIKVLRDNLHLQQRIEVLRGNLKLWAEVCPENYLHKHLLVEAEAARLRGDYWGAMPLYQEAIQSALEQEYINTGALANELYGKFLLGQNLRQFAQIYLREAHYLYGRWGASAKVAAMQQVHGDLLTEEPIRKTGLKTTRTLSNSSQTTTHSSHTELDLAAVMKASQAISGEIVLARLLEQLMHIVLVNAGAQTGALILRQAQTKPWLLEARGCTDPLHIEVLQSQPLADCGDLCESVVHYAVRTRTTVLLHHASQEGLFTQDPYIVRKGVKSILCFPILHQGQLIGLIYLENNLASGTFTAERLEMLTLLSSQIAISIENSRLYAQLEEKVRERTDQLLEKNLQIATLLDNSGQGFLSCGKDLMVEPGYSRECMRIFQREVLDKPLPELLCPQDEDRRYFVAETLQLVIEGDADPLRFDAYLSLLPKEYALHERYYEAEYRLLGDGRMMLILTDISDEKVLQQRLTQERLRLEFVVNALENRDDLLEALRDFDTFRSRTLPDLLSFGSQAGAVLAEIFRHVHTFKSLFAQASLPTLPAVLHELETRLGQLRDHGNAIDFNAIKCVLAGTDLGLTLEEDIAILRDKLGNEYFSPDKEIRIPAAKLKQIEASVNALCARNAIAATTGAKIIELVRQLRFEPLQKLIEPHFKAAEQLAARQEKMLAPILYEGDMALIDPEVYGPFCKSLVHLLRNAVDHGIEDPDTRLMADKNEVARIRCRVQTGTDHLTLTFSDDGQGIDPAYIRAKALELGKTQATDLIDAQALKLIFLDGLTTRSEVSTISGRGVGLAAVYQELERLGGMVQVDSTLGQGTQFVFTLPYRPTVPVTQGQHTSKLTDRLLAPLPRIMHAFCEEHLKLAVTIAASHQRISDTALFEFTVLLQLGGGVDATLGLSIDRPLLLEMARCFEPGCTQEEVEELANSVGAEIANILFGNATVYYTHLTADLSMSTPHILTPEERQHSLNSHALSGFPGSSAAGQFIIFAF